MRWTIPVDLPKGELEISYDTRQMMLGSCFAENIGKRLDVCKFPLVLNPFGILYNPLSIAAALSRIIDGTPFTDDSPEFLFHGGRWHSMLHHGDFSRAEKCDAVNAVNAGLAAANKAVQGLGLLTLTFGTAYVYRRKCDGSVVGNCHKIPASEFVRSLLSVDEIVDALSPIFERLIAINPEMKILLTVSPIRHVRDGAHGNQVSKSVLHLAVEELRRRFPQSVHYFPAYEIVLDELRDYRFYADDMVHPSGAAVEYVWECFKSCYFNEKTASIADQAVDIARALAHKPFDPGSQAYRDFKSQLVLKIEAFKEKYPFFDFSNELEQCRTR